MTNDCHSSQGPPWRLVWHASGHNGSVAFSQLARIGWLQALLVMLSNYCEAGLF
jgi:hypothetical protein